MFSPSWLSAALTKVISGGSSLLPSLIRTSNHFSTTGLPRLSVGVHSSKLCYGIFFAPLFNNMSLSLWRHTEVFFCFFLVVFNTFLYIVQHIRWEQVSENESRKIATTPRTLLQYSGFATGSLILHWILPNFEFQPLQNWRNFEKFECTHCKLPLRYPSFVSFSQNGITQEAPSPICENTP